jgi:hypothetical protein
MSSSASTVLAFLHGGSMSCAATGLNAHRWSSVSSPGPDRIASRRRVAAPTIPRFPIETYGPGGADPEPALHVGGGLPPKHEPRANRACRQRTRAWSLGPGPSSSWCPATTPGRHERAPPRPRHRSCDRASGAPFRACFVSGGPLLTAHRQMAARLRIEDVTVLTDWVTDPFAFLQHGTVLVLLSLEEASGSLACLRRWTPGWRSSPRTSMGFPRTSSMARVPWAGAGMAGARDVRREALRRCVHPRLRRHVRETPRLVRVPLPSSPNQAGPGGEIDPHGLALSFDATPSVGKRFIGCGLSWMKCLAFGRPPLVVEKRNAIECHAELLLLAALCGRGRGEFTLIFPTRRTTVPTRSCRLAYAVCGGRSSRRCRGSARPRTPNRSVPSRSWKA